MSAPDKQPDSFVGCMIAGALFMIVFAMLSCAASLFGIRTELFAVRTELVQLRTETIQTRTEIMSLHASILLNLSGSCEGFRGEPGSQLKIGDRVLCYVDESGNVRRNAP